MNDGLPKELEQEATEGRRLIILSIDGDLALSLEECPIPGYLLSGVADWLALYAESMMNEELAEEASEDE